MNHSPGEVQPYVAPPLRLHGFRALRLSATRVGDPASARAFARPYRAVAERLREWQRRGHVVREETSALYVHEYTTGGLTVRGVVGAMELSRRVAGPASSAVIPHEGVHTAQARELALRMREMEMNPAPILLLHRGAGSASRILDPLLARPADIAYDDRAGQRQRIWAIHEAKCVDELNRHLADARMLLADGHHRFAAYLEIQERYPGTGWDRGLAMVVDQDDTPLHLGAIHRVLPDARVEEVARVVADLGLSADTASRPAALARLGRSTPVAGSGDDWRVLDLHVDQNELAACILHDRVIPALPRRARRVTYHHTVQDALEATDDSGTAVLMPAPEFDVVLSQSAAGTLLPEKTTSFQPKPSLGVLMRSPIDS